ncbi:hypothetical protein [Acinetobacter indicus]|uniref:hypothetical protein n=1 Tax=Acinetobacter indicus TaxID=756892 RepID=UPI001E65D581|nr:hypothetical protein [Acinetobacter indicus]
MLKKYAKKTVRSFAGHGRRTTTKKIVVGIDRGVTIPVHAGYEEFDFSKEQKNHLTKADRYIKRLQRKTRSTSKKAQTEELRLNIELRCITLRKPIFARTLLIRQVIA